MTKRQFFQKFPFILSFEVNFDENIFVLSTFRTKMLKTLAPVEMKHRKGCSSGTTTVLQDYKEQI